VRGLLAGVMLDEQGIDAVVQALAGKDAAELKSLCTDFSAEAREGLQALLRLYGGVEVLDAAERALPARPLIQAALKDLRWLAEHVAQAHPKAQVGFDLADLGGYAYYSGTRFAVYAPGSSDALLRGGRYDEVGAVFGRNRPAVGFSLDIKELAALTPALKQSPAVRAPWAEDASLRSAVRALREAGETVACVLPGHEHEGQEFDCDRELVSVGGQWVLRAL
jgi:ATP phosphoribosyltransferase regulatory subunit